MAHSGDSVERKRRAPPVALVMAVGSSFALLLLFVAGCGDGGTSGDLAVESAHGGEIRVDQFGYRPDDPKVAVLVDPATGGIGYRPGATIEVRRWDDDRSVAAGAPTPWRDGGVHEQSGDRGWWFDFSDVTETGSYYVIDVDNDLRGDRFEIGDGVYDDVLDAALKMFWFNRANVAHPATLAGEWSDAAAYIGPGQDGEARFVDAPDDPTTALDLSGGWFDAGDPNKYVTFATEPVHLLLTAYTNHPTVFDDAVGIPESGNGVPDVLDEVRVEIGWLARMQRDDGGVLSKVGLVDSGAPLVPSESRLPRYYEQVCSSATIAAAGMFAHAATVFGSVPALADEAPVLRSRAESAYSAYQVAEKRDDCDRGLVRAGDADLSLEEQENAAVVAATYLFALTGDPAYDETVAEGYAATLPFTDDGFGRYGPEQGDALLAYRSLPGANRATVAGIEERLETLRTDSTTYGFDEADLYRAFMPDEQYHWGSNMVTANTGSTNIAIGEVRGGRERALGHLHYLHGVNPLGLVYLTNMGAHGAERSARTMFHFWFGEGTAFDVDSGSTIGVAPGYLVGGPNHSYSGTASPPDGRPPQRSFRDEALPSEPIWEVTEPAIYYQAAYVRLLAAVMA